MGLVWGLGGFDGFDTFFFSLYKALRYIIQVCTILDSLQPNTTVTFKVTLYMINVVITFQQYTLLTHCYTYFNSLFYFRARPHYVNHQSIINHSLLTQLPGPALLVYDGCCRALYGPLA